MCCIELSWCDFHFCAFGWQLTRVTHLTQPESWFWALTLHDPSESVHVKLSMPPNIERVQAAEFGVRKTLPSGLRLGQGSGRSRNVKFTIQACLVAFTFQSLHPTLTSQPTHILLMTYVFLPKMCQPHLATGLTQMLQSSLPLRNILKHTWCLHGSHSSPTILNPIVLQPVHYKLLQYMLQPSFHTCHQIYHWYFRVLTVSQDFFYVQ